MKSIHLTLIALLAISCNTRQTMPHTVQENTSPVLNRYSEMAEKTGKPESTPRGNYFNLVLANDSMFRIQWGNNRIQRETSQSFYLSIARNLRLEWENNDFLALRGGYGTGAWYTIFLPLDSHAKEFTLDNALARDETRNLVVAEQFPGTDTILVVHNLHTKKSQYVLDTLHCESAFYHSCLDTVIVANSRLYYRWSTPHKVAKYPIQTERELSIVI